jgi:hypothetical protein
MLHVLEFTTLLTPPVRQQSGELFRSYIRELQCSDDPVRAQLTAEERNHQEDAAVETPRKTAKGWEVTRDIRLGENVKDYKPCSATK